LSEHAPNAVLCHLYLRAIGRLHIYIDLALVSPVGIGANSARPARCAPIVLTEFQQSLREAVAQTQGFFEGSAGTAVICTVDVPLAQFWQKRAGQGK